MTATEVAIGLGRSFDAWATDYDRYRPGYPDRLFERIAARLELPSRPVVVDLGAGTGRATLAMAARGWNVTAVEPGGPMLDILRARAAAEGVVVATRQAHAEDTAIGPATADLVTAAQAFHWFERDRAVAEMARIVRPGGGVAVFWNVRDETRSDFVAAYHDLLELRFGSRDTGRYLQAGRPVGREPTRAALERSRAFRSIQFEELAHEVTMSADEFIGMAFTASYVRAQGAADQAAFRKTVAGLLARYGGSDNALVVPYRVDLWTAQRTDG